MGAYPAPMMTRSKAMTDKILIPRQLLEELLGFAESNLRELEARMQTTAIKAGKAEVKRIVDEASALLLRP